MHDASCSDHGRNGALAEIERVKRPSKPSHAERDGQHGQRDADLESARERDGDAVALRALGNDEVRDRADQPMIMF